MGHNRVVTSRASTHTFRVVFEYTTQPDRIPTHVYHKPRLFAEVLVDAPTERAAIDIAEQELAADLENTQGVDYILHHAERA